MRNNRLYELAVFVRSGNKGHNRNRMLFRFRDSLNLLPGKLSSLANNLCPGLGAKGSIPYDDVSVSTLVSMKDELIDYMKQDILLLGGVMQKAQEIYWKLYKVDIESKITLSSLAISIYRMKYYDASNWPIHGSSPSLSQLPGHTVILLTTGPFHTKNFPFSLHTITKELDGTWATPHPVSLKILVGDPLTPHPIHNRLEMRVELTVSTVISAGEKESSKSCMTALTAYSI